MIPKTQIILFILVINSVFTSLGYTDNELIQKWSDRALLKDESGWIYLVEDDYGRSFLKCFDVKTGQWQLWKEDGPSIEQIAWDVEGDLLACYIRVEPSAIPRQELNLFRIPIFDPIVKIKGNFVRVKISPDLKKIAVLERVGSVVAYKDSDSYYHLGDKCHLKVIEISSGRTIAEASRMALEYGLCWSSDSNQVIFVSFQNENLFLPSFEDMSADTFHGGMYVNKGPFSGYLYLLTIGNGDIQYLTRGYDPVLISQIGNISFLRNDSLYQINLTGGDAELVMSDLKVNLHEISPTGKIVLAYISYKWPPKWPFGGEIHYLTSVDVNDSSRKFIVDPSDRILYFRWVYTDKATTQK